MKGTRSVLIGVGVAVALLGAACAKSTTAASGNQPSSPPATSASPTDSSSGDSGNLYGSGGRYGGGSSTSSGKSGTIEQGAGGFVFSPNKLTVKKGQSITVTNVGTASHTFTISSKGIDVTNAPGTSQKVSIKLAPGTYVFICRFHVSLGMKGTLTVKA
jgi:plastocyanin